MLDLRHNRIGDVGATALAKHLHACGSLRELVLSHNRIGEFYGMVLWRIYGGVIGLGACRILKAVGF